MVGDEAEVEFRVGDVLSVACPFTEARVESVEPDGPALEWPWWERDPGSGGWNGVVVLGFDPRTGGWDGRELFRTDPAPAHLVPGGVCRVGVPATAVHVTGVQHFDPPLETAWLPRPRLVVTVLPLGLSRPQSPPGTHPDETGFEIYPHDGIPFTFEPLFRPYAFLRPGDEVADAAGRAWRFDGPWDWHAFDGGTDRPGPAWPLTLLGRAGGPCPEEAARTVADATATGSHTEVLVRWATLTRAGPARPGGG
jgi:hypothetical protein